MRTNILIVAGLLLCACKPQPPAVSEAEPAPAITADATAAEPASATGAPPGIDAVTPSFDCAKASDESEKLVCADSELSALDRRLAEE